MTRLITRRFILNKCVLKFSNVVMDDWADGQNWLIGKAIDVSIGR